MSQWCRDVRGVVAGLLTGVIVTVAAGQVAAPAGRQPPVQPVPRYQISAVSIQRNGVGGEEIFILDHQTQKLYRKSADRIQGNAPTVEQFIQP
jgi:hypothetical protein